MASKKASPTMNVMVTVEPPHRERLEAVASDLRSAGMKVAVPVEGPVIFGEVAQADLAKLHAVAGIQAVEEEPHFHADR